MVLAIFSDETPNLVHRTSLAATYYTISGVRSIIYTFRLDLSMFYNIRWSMNQNCSPWNNVQFYFDKKMFTPNPKIIPIHIYSSLAWRWDSHRFGLLYSKHNLKNKLSHMRLNFYSTMRIRLPLRGNESENYTKKCRNLCSWYELNCKRNLSQLIRMITNTWEKLQWFIILTLVMEGTTTILSLPLCHFQGHQLKIIDTIFKHQISIIINRIWCALLEQPKSNLCR